jgi:cytochrome c
VLGEPIGQGRGFAFSDGLAKKGGTWNWDNLSQWLTSPKAFSPGTKMTFAGLGNPQDRANVIDFLNQHSDHPLPLPAAPAQAAAKPGEGGKEPAAAGNAAEANAAAPEAKTAGPAPAAKH